MKKVYTLLFVHQHPLILLAIKKRKIGAGKWNGYGGRVEEGESIEEAAKREVFEECGIQLSSVEKLGINEFKFQGSDDLIEVHVFRAENFTGEPRETEEMGPPTWFPVGEIPYENMWVDDTYWMPLFLQGKKFKGSYIFSPEEKLLEHTIVEVEQLA